MRGNSFLNLDFNSKRQRPQNMSNRRAFHYSYNLINNLGSEEAKKDSAKKLGSKAVPDGSSPYDSTVPRKLSLPSKNASSTTSIRKNSNHENGKIHTVTGEPKNSVNGYHNGLTRAKNGIFDMDKVMASRPSVGARFSDPLYEQRSLPPLPFNKPRGGSEGTIYSSVDNLTNQKRNLQMSSKSQSLNYVSGPGSNLSRKEGLSAIENLEIMQGKLRKRGVVDSTDESHYQRQFLRVLNKRF